MYLRTWEFEEDIQAISLIEAFESRHSQDSKFQRRSELDVEKPADERLNDVLRDEGSEKEFLWLDKIY